MTATKTNLMHNVGGIAAETTFLPDTYTDSKGRGWGYCVEVGTLDGRPYYAVAQTCNGRALPVRRNAQPIFALAKTHEAARAAGVAYAADLSARFAALSIA